MKKLLKKLTVILLSAAMMISMLPSMAITVNAATNYSSTASFSIPSPGGKIDSSACLPGGKIAVIKNTYDANYVRTGSSILIYDSTGTQIKTIDITSAIQHKITNNSNGSETFGLYGLSNGNILVYWDSEGSDTGLKDAYFLILDQTGAIIKAETEIDVPTGSADELNRFTRVAELSNTDIAFIWATNGSNYALRTFDISGNNPSAETSITDKCELTGSMYDHYIAASKDGTFMVVLNCYFQNNYKGIVFNNDTSVKKSVFNISTVYKGGSAQNYVIPLSNGNFLVAFEGEPTANNSDLRDSRIAIFNSDGTPVKETILATIGNTNIDSPIALKQGGYVLYNNTSNTVTEYDNTGSTVVSGIPIVDNAITTDTNYLVSSLYAGYDRGLAVVSPVTDRCEIGLYDFATNTVPTATTQAVTSISATTATGNGCITSLGVPNPTQYGVVWSTSSNPTVALDTKTVQGAASATGAFTSSITSLTPSTTYFVKAYATNSEGTVYGSEVSFTTLPATPTISSISPSSGPTAGGTSVVITGTSLTGTTAVKFGSTNASSYTVDSATQITATSPAGSAGTVNITVTTTGGTSATDSAGQFTYVSAPTVASVAIPGNGIYKIGDNLDFTVNFSKAVTASTNNGTPYLALTIGGDTMHAAYISGSGTSALVFRYTVVADNNDNDGIAVGALTLNGATIRDSNNINANITLNGMGSTSAILVDTIAPSAPSSPALSSASDTGASNTDNITSRTTPAITGTAEAGSTVTLYDTDGTTVLGAGMASGGAFLITASPLLNGVHIITAKATDAAGNTSAASSSLTVTVDTTAPTVTGVTNTSIYNTAATPTFTEGTATLSKDSGSATLFTTGTAISANGSYKLTVTDAAGNSTVVNFTVNIPSATAPGAPTAVLAAAGNTQAAVSFTLPASDGGSAITSYTVTSNPGGKTATGSASPITVTGLTNGTSYTFTVTANNIVGSSSASLPSNSVTIGCIEKAITAFSIGSASGTIDETNHTIAVTVPHSTSLNSLSPTITVSTGASVSPASGIQQNFTNPVTYTVTAQNGTQQAYIVTVKAADKTLVSITAPPAIAGIANGTVKTAVALGLPATVVLATNNGNVDADVNWDVDGSSYDASKTTEQTFTVNGTVTVPAGVVNPNNIPLTTAISVTVKAASGGDPTKNIITSFLMDYTTKTVPYGTDFASLNLPDKFKAVGDQISDLWIKVTGWLHSTYKSNVAGAYTMTAVLDGGYVDSGYVLGDGVSAPQIKVTVGSNPDHHSDRPNSKPSSSATDTSHTETKVDKTGNTATVTTKPDSVTTSGNTADIETTVASVTIDNTTTFTNGSTVDTTKKTAVTIDVPTEEIKQQLNAKKNVELTVTVPSEVTKDTTENVEVTINANKEILEAAKENLSDVTIKIKDADTQQMAYSWTFKGADLAKSTTPMTDVNIAMSVHLTTEVSKVDIITPNNKGLVLSFDHSGLLPSVASVKFSALEKGFKPGETLYFYYYNPATKQIESLGNDAYVVDADGTVTVQIVHCSDYVLLPHAARSITLDTRTYTMAPKKSYEIGVKLANASDATIKAYSSTKGVANVTILKNGNCKVTGVKSGLTYIMIDVYDNKNKFLTHASVRVTVQNGVKSNGNSARQYGIF